MDHIRFGDELCYRSTERGGFKKKKEIRRHIVEFETLRKGNAESLWRIKQTVPSKKTSGICQESDADSSNLTVGDLLVWCGDTLCIISAIHSGTCFDLIGLNGMVYEGKYGSFIRVGHYEIIQHLLDAIWEEYIRSETQNKR